MKHKLLLFLTILGVFTSTIYAQNIDVNGIVVDAYDEPKYLYQRAKMIMKILNRSKQRKGGNRISRLPP